MTCACTPYFIPFCCSYLHILKGSTNSKTVWITAVFNQKSKYYSGRKHLGTPPDAHVVRLPPFYLIRQYLSNPTKTRPRKTEAPPSQSFKELLLESSYTPTSTLVQAIMESSHRTHRHPRMATRNCIDAVTTEANTGYWKFTKHYAEFMHWTHSVMVW